MLLQIMTIQTSVAANILCYSNGKPIYKGQAKDVSYTKDFLVFTDAKTKLVTFVFADCIVKVNENDLKKHKLA